MATGLKLGLDRLRARRQPLCSDDGDPNTEFVSKLKRDREEFKDNHPLPPLPSGEADAASKRQNVAPPASPGRPTTDTSARPPPYELVVESPDDMQSYVVDPALPLRDTLLYQELSPGSHLRLDGERLDAAKSASELGLAHGAVLQVCAPQVGGGYDEDEAFEAAFEADMGVEREMEAERQHAQPHGQSRRRSRVVAESEDEAGVTDEGRPRQRRRQRVAAESEDDEPIVGREAEGREDVGRDAEGREDVGREAEGREEQEGAAAGEAMGDARPDRREEGEALVARIMSLGREVKSLEAAAAVLSVGSGSTPISERLNRAEMVRAQKAYKWAAARVHPDKLPECRDATAAFQVLKQAWSLWQERFESSGNAGDEMDCSDDEGGADEDGAPQAAPDNEQQAQQERQTKAQEASERAAKFQEQQRDRVRAPAIADSGMQSWDGVVVVVAQLDESKVRDAHHSPRAPHHRHRHPRCRCPTLARGSRSRRCVPCTQGRPSCCSPRRPTRC